MLHNYWYELDQRTLYFLRIGLWMALFGTAGLFVSMSSNGNASLFTAGVMRIDARVDIIAVITVGALAYAEYKPVLLAHATARASRGFGSIRCSELVLTAYLAHLAVVLVIALLIDRLDAVLPWQVPLIGTISFAGVLMSSLLIDAERPRSDHDH